MPRGTLTIVSLAVALLALVWSAFADVSAWPAAVPRHVALLVAAGGVWAAALWVVPRLERVRGQLAVILVVSVLLRAPGWLLPPAHSNDVYRYLWDGKVQRAGIDPYAHPPEAERLKQLRDDAYQRLNNRELPTIYPPFAQLLFRAAAILPVRPLAAWKLIIAACDLVILLLLHAWLKRRNGDPRRLLLWGWSPLVAVELAHNAHVDGAAVLLLYGALFALELGRQARAGALLALSVATKLLSVSLLPLLGNRRALMSFAAVVLLAALPYRAAGWRLAGSLGEYGRRWRANDGAFALLQAASSAIVARSRFARRHEMDRSPRMARFITGRDRDQVYPDEVAGFAGRCLALALFLAALAWTLASGAPSLRVAEVILGAYLLLTPTLHPWYVLWILPMLAIGGSPAWIALSALAPLGYLPLRDFLAGQPWHDAVWPRLLEHGLTWAILLSGWIGCRFRAVPFDIGSRRKKPCNICC